MDFDVIELLFQLFLMVYNSPYICSLTNSLLIADWVRLFLIFNTIILKIAVNILIPRALADFISGPCKGFTEC